MIRVIFLFWVLFATPTFADQSKTDLLEQRKNVATSFEYRLLDQGLDTHVSLAKDSSSTLVIQYSRLNRVMARHIFNAFYDTYDMYDMYDIGFRKITISDNHSYNESQTLSGKDEK